MSRKQPKRRAGNMVFNAIVGIFIVAVVCGVGFGVASADSSDDLARAGAFGFDETTHAATARPKAAPGSLVAGSREASTEYREQSVLATTSKRTINAGLKMIDKRERAERRAAEKRAAAEAARVERENATVMNRVEEKRAMQGGCDYGLTEVDWSVGHDAFVQEWAGRIDAYLEGSPLSGYGKVFAQAAWENGVDPRWSPAISNTESTKGQVCFMPCNAWGWGSSGWDNWETAIHAHVAGLAEVYGYSITPDAAAVYCPPNHDFWYATTYGQMQTI